MQTISPSAASRIMPRIEELAGISESTDFLSRRFASAEHRQANDLVSYWMQSAGMSTNEDAIGNIVGRYDSAKGADAPAIMLGSHLDTVVNAGRYDGMLGVLSALACVETLNESETRLPFAIEVIGFADEEGVRYQSTYLGSRAVTGQFNQSVFSRKDSDGISFTDALKAFGSNVSRLPTAVRQPEDIHAYLEVHIEQGPVLEEQGQSVGVVSGIAGATRLSVSLTGLAGHAGTVPMTLRQDALVAAAHCVVQIESICSAQQGLVGTVGHIVAKPNAGNVIVGDVQFSVDIRAASDQLRIDSVNNVVETMTKLCRERDITIDIDYVHQAPSIDCDKGIMQHMQQALKSHGMNELVMPSGAGHDAAAMAELTSVGMLFVRCAGGVSHHPDESVSQQDAIDGANILLQTVMNICENE